MKECAELLAGIMEKSKIKASIYPTDRHPIVYGERIEDETLPTMLVYGHYDVQPPEPLGEWESEPFEPYGTGKYSAEEYRMISRSYSLISKLHRHGRK